jgi:hypothetical protein
VVYESRLELSRLLLADFDPNVVAIAAQPFCIASRVNGKDRRHVPDFLLISKDGVVTVVNVKPADQMRRPKVVEALSWAGRLFADKGWRHEVWSGSDAVVLSNVRFLAAYRHADRVDPDALAAVSEGVTGICTVGEVERHLEARFEADVCRPALLHLIWRGALRADLHSALSAATTLERVA